ncbi:MAG: pyridoxamine 5'-phosphate oxidase family protein [Acetobacteraceae bacterium]|nr:pyridoxamine 5'-phosphate oxidase family protein [Acetobacteraceae bacterium]
MDDPHAITTLDALLAQYPPVLPVAATKATDRIGPATAAFIAASPFCLLGTQGPRGVHVTPRGDAPGFVAVADEKTLLLPDRRGNNRLDGLRDLIGDPRCSLLFLIPGVAETLRVHGRARITADPALRARFAVEGKEPATVLVLAVEEVFAHCAKAFLRSALWDGRPKPDGVPSMAKLLAEHRRDAAMDVAGYDATYQERVRVTMY